MPTIQDIRAKLPQYADLSDNALVDVVHQAYYPTVDRAVLAAKLGVQPEAPAEAPKKSGRVLARMGDTGLSLLKGAIGVPETAVGLADLATGGRVGKFLANEGGDIGFRPKEAREYLDTFLSPEQQAANREVQQADGVLDTIGAAVRNPSVIFQGAVESLPSIGSGGVAAQGMRRVLPRMGAMVAGAAGEGVVSAGQGAEQIRQQTPDGLLTPEQSAVAAGSGAATGLLGALGGRIAKSLGIADVDAMVAGAVTNPVAAKGLTRRVLEGAVSEGLLEELPQSVQEQVAQNYALGKPLDEGVNQAAVLGALTGGAIGGAVNLMPGHGASVPAPMAPPAVVPPAPVAPPPAGPLTRAVKVGAGVGAIPPVAAVPPGVDPATGEVLADGGGLGAPVDLPTIEGPDGTQRAVFGSQAEGEAYVARVRKQARNTAIREQVVPMGDGRWTLAKPGEPGHTDAATIAPEDMPDAGADVPGADRMNPRTGKPWTNRMSVLKAAKEAPGYEPIKTAAGWVLRPIQADAGLDLGTDTSAEGAQEQMPPADAPAATVADAPASGAEGMSESLGGTTPAASAFNPAEPGEGTGAPATADEAAAPQAPVAPVLQPEPVPTIDAAAHEAAPSPKNDRAEPTDAQKEAGNYKKGHDSINGLPISFENPAGSVRRGTDRDGKAWENTLQHHYGYFKGTVGNDKDHVDVFVKPETPRDYAGPVFVVDQVHPDTGKFDEHKVLLGFADIEEAKTAYRSNYAKGWKGLKAISTMPFDEFKAWVYDGPKNKPLVKITDAPANAAPPAAGQPATPEAQPDQAPAQAASDAGEARDAGVPAAGPAPAPAQADGVSDGAWWDTADQSARFDALKVAGWKFGVAGPSASAKQTAAKAWNQLTDSQRARVQAARVANRPQETVDAQSSGDVADATGVASGARDEPASDAGASQPDVGRASSDGGQLQAAADRPVAGSADAVPDRNGSADTGGALVDQRSDATEQPAASAKIEDAGEKIGGARKDRWKERGLDVTDLDAMSEAEGATLVTKANVWKPDYVAMAEATEPVTAAMVKVVYDSLAAKPKTDTPQGRRDYVTAMQAVRTVYGAVQSVEQARDAYQQLREVLGVRKRDGAGWTESGDKDAKRVLFSVYKGRTDPFVFDTTMLMRARSMVKDGFPNIEAWKTRFAIRGAGGPGLTPKGRELALAQSQELGTPLTTEQIAAGYAEVLTKQGKTVAMMPTREEAEAKAKELYESTKGRGDDKQEPERPHLDKIIREGMAESVDRDVTPEKLLQDFGFRGVEWGNWAAQDERQRILNLAYDGLADLALVLNVPRKAIGLNGTMGLAFGARGGGRFAAHYEPGKLVINMTKLRGAGSLAHEWAHAFDHYLGELDQADAYQGKARGASGWHEQQQYDGQPRRETVRDGVGGWKTDRRYRLDNLRPELARAIDGVMNSLFNVPIPREDAIRMAVADVERIKAYLADKAADPSIKKTYAEGLARAEKALQDLRDGKAPERYTMSDFAKQARALSGKSQNGYWIRPTEMFARAFESWVFDRVRGMGARSDYLVHGVEEERYTDKNRYKGNPYPTGDERKGIDAAFDAMVAEIKTRQDDAGNVAMFSRRADAAVDLPPVVIGAGLASASSHADYPAAKSGDAAAALRLARDLVTDKMVEDVRALLGESRPIVVPVVSVEAAGRNKIPAMVGVVLANRLGLTLEVDIAQSNSPKRTAMDGLQRLLSPPEFDGDVQQGADYLLVDDTLTQGGTFAALASHIQAGGGRVLGAFALTGKGYSAKIAPDQGLLRTIHERFNDVEPAFRAATGYGFDALTESEARYLAHFKPIERARARILEAGARASRAVGDERTEDDRPKLSLSGPKAAMRRSIAINAGMPVDQIREHVADITAKWLNAPEVVMVASLRDSAVPAAVRKEDARQQSQGASGQPEGFFYGGKVYLMAPELHSLADVRRVLFHEALGHYGLRGLYGKGLQDILAQIVAARAVEVKAKTKEYGLNWADKRDRLVAAEEVLAEMAQRTPTLGFVRRAIAAVRSWLRGLGLKGLALSDDEIIAQFILPARAFVTQGRDTQVGDALPAFQRGVGKADQTDTPAFKAWFGDSKVVDTEGKPLVVYHGTASDFSEFRTSKYENGIYFTPSLPYAEGRGRVAALMVRGREAGGENVMPVYLHMENPAPPGYGVDRAKAEGFDGLVRGEGNMKEYVVLRPEQIKSAIGNAGTFDPTNPDIRFSRAKVVDRVRDSIADQIAAMKEPTVKGMNWWHRTVGTQYQKARDNPAFGRVFSAAQSYIDDSAFFANTAADMAPSLLPRLDSLADLKKRLSLDENDADMVSRAVFTGTLDDQQVYTPGELRQRFNLTGEQLADGSWSGQIGLYQQFRRAVDLSLQQLVSGEVVRYLGDKMESMPSQLPAMVSQGRYGEFRTLVQEAIQAQRDEYDRALQEARRANRNSMSRLAERQRKALEGKGSRAGTRLAIMERFDTERAALKVENGRAIAEAKQRFELWETMRLEVKDKFERIDQLQMEGYAPLMRFGKFTVDVVDGMGDEPERLFFGMYETEAEAIKAEKALRGQFGDYATVTRGVDSQESWRMFGGVDPSTLEIFADAAGLGDNALAQQWIKLATSNRNAMKRKLHRQGIAGFSGDVSRVLSAFLTSNARATANGVHMGDMDRAIADIPKGAGDVKDEAVKLREYIRNPQEEAQKVRGLLFMSFLGGSVASAMVNMTQPLTMTLPWLSQYGGMAKAGRLLASAVRDSVGKPKDPALAQALQEAGDRGIVSPQELHQLEAEASRTLGSKPAVRKALFAWGALFSLAEQFNRRVTFVAAWRAAQDIKGMDPMRFAERAVEETQGIYSKANRPNWARGAIGATVFTFKQYSISYLEMLNRMWNAGPPGSAQRAAGRKAALTALAILIMMAGTDGLPFADDVDDLIDTLGQNWGYATNAQRWRTEVLQEALGEDMAEVVLRGMSGVLPIDVSGRLSMSNLIPATGLLRRDTQDKGREITEAVGPIGGLITNSLQAAAALLEGDPAKAARVGPVTAAKNIAQAVDMADTGQYRDIRGRKVVDTTFMDAIYKAVGFQPEAVASEQREIGMRQQDINLARVVESEIVQQWADGMVESDPSKVAAARERLAEWNEKNPGTPIKINPQQPRQRAAAMRRSKAERQDKAAPKELRRQPEPA